MGFFKTIKRDPEIAHELAARVADSQPYRLLDMKLYLTRRCNLRCIMCNAWAEAGHGRDELSTAELIRVISQARLLGLANLKLFGGEPVLRWDLETLVETASGLGIRCMLITNGTLLTERRAQSLVGAGLAELNLSLDASDPALHDQIRGVPGTWSRAVQGLQFVQRAARRLDRPMTIRVNAVVMRQNYPDMPRLVAMLSELAVDEIVLNPVVAQRDNGRGAAADYVLTRADLVRYNEEIAPQIRTCATAYRLSRNLNFSYCYGTTEQDIENASQGRYVDRLQIGCCFKPWYYMIVRENGDVLGCNTVKHPMARIGNVRERAVDEIWFSEGYRAFRSRCNPPQFEECGRCCYHFALLNKRIGEVLAERGDPPSAAGQTVVLAGRT